MDELVWTICTTCTRWFGHAHNQAVRPYCTECMGYSQITKQVRTWVANVSGRSYEKSWVEYGLWSIPITISKL